MAEMTEQEAIQRVRAVYPDAYRGYSPLGGNIWRTLEWNDEDDRASLGETWQEAAAALPEPKQDETEPTAPSRVQSDKCRNCGNGIKRYLSNYGSWIHLPNAGIPNVTVWCKGGATKAEASSQQDEPKPVVQRPKSGPFAWDSRKWIARLESEVDRLERENQELRTEIARLRNG